MIFTETRLAGAYIVDLEPFSDERGMFFRTFCKKEFEQIGHKDEWVQINHSITYKKNSLRGMHFQFPPYTEIKLVRCIAGAVFDVIIDIRKGSSTFLQWFGIELSAFNKKMLYIPAGFAHGFQTLANNCELIYHHSSFYMPGYEGGIRYDDKRIGIRWMEPIVEISPKDNNHPYLEELFTGIIL